VDPGEIDLLDPKRFEESVPHEWFTYLRHHAPVLQARGAGRSRLLGGHPLRRRRRS